MVKILGIVSIPVFKQEALKMQQWMILLFVHRHIFHLILMEFVCNEFLREIPFRKMHSIIMYVYTYYLFPHERGSKEGNFKILTFNAVYCKMIILMDYWWAIEKIGILFLKGAQIPNICIFGRYIEFFFQSILIQIFSLNWLDWELSVDGFPRSLMVSEIN